MRLRTYLRLLLLLPLALMLAGIAWLARERDSAGTPITDGAPLSGVDGTVMLAQGWTHELQQRAWTASFGSRLLPYEWFLSLEQPGSRALFREPGHLRSLGFLEQPATRGNPDALPVGVVRSVDAEGTGWIGLGCPACHTGELRHGEQSIRIAGGAGLIDLRRFESRLAAALRETLADDARFQRFAQRMADAPTRAALEARTQAIERRLAVNRTSVAYGPGRMDAFGEIFNTIGVEVLGIEDNRHEPDAPVSIPVLWGTPRLELVQWNGSSPNDAVAAVVQNVTTALAVYGSVDASEYRGIGYDSSVDLRALGRIQRWNTLLRAPRWPEALLGRIDEARATRGAALYDTHCANCHRRNVDAGTAPAVVLLPLAEVGTDPLMARNFAMHEGETGALEGRRRMVLGGEPFGARARTIDLVVHMALGATTRHPLDAAFAAMLGRAPVAELPPEPRELLAYRARPLDGVWSSAPYLHNGSVPTLADLLLPAAERPRSFAVGSRRFDTGRVGLEGLATGAGDFVFDVAQRGNDNGGHEYGTALSPEEKREIVEFLKTL